MTSLFRRAKARVAKFIASLADADFDPAALSLYTKSVDSVDQLFARTTDGTVYRLTPAGGLATRITPTLVANQDDWNPTGLSAATMIEITVSGATRTITGLQGGIEGRIIYLHNSFSSGQTLVVMGENVGSSAANRFRLADGNSGGASLNLPSSSGLLLIYSNSRWCEIAKVNTYNFTASNNITSQGTMTVAGNIQAGSITLSTLATLATLAMTGTATVIASDQNDWVPNSFNISCRVEAAPDAPRTVTGIAQGFNNRVVLLSNFTAFTLTLAHQSASSTAANRFVSPTGVDYVLLGGRSVWLVYTGSRWQIILQP